MCPSCGYHRAWALHTGYDEDGRMVRARQCRSCGTDYTTIEVAVPLPFYRLNVKDREKNRLRMRQKRGYVGVHHTTADPPRVEVHIKVHDKHKRRPALPTAHGSRT